MNKTIANLAGPTRADLQSVCNSKELKASNCQPLAEVRITN